MRIKTLLLLAATAAATTTATPDEQCGIVFFDLEPQCNWPAPWTDTTSFQLPPDINRDCYVDVIDLLYCIHYWGDHDCAAAIPTNGKAGPVWPQYQNEEGLLPFHMADIDRDFNVGVGDLVIVLNAWGLSDPPGTFGDPGN